MNEENNEDMPENITKLHELIMDYVNKSHVKTEHFFSYISLLLVRSLAENGFEQDILDHTCDQMKEYFKNHKKIYGEKEKKDE